MSGMYFDNKFYMTAYQTEIYLDVLTEDPEEQYIGMERLNFFFRECLSNVIFISSKHTSKINELINLGFKVSTLPYEPYDQTIAYAIIHKANAITENRYLITDIVFGSDLSDGIQYVIEYEDDSGEYADKNGWWHDSSTIISDVKKIKTTEKIVKLTKMNCDWSEVNLNWKSPVYKNKAEIVFTINPDKN